MSSAASVSGWAAATCRLVRKPLFWPRGVMGCHLSQLGGRTARWMEPPGCEFCAGAALIEGCFLWRRRTEHRGAGKSADRWGSLRMGWGFAGIGGVLVTTNTTRLVPHAVSVGRRVGETQTGRHAPGWDMNARGGESPVTRIALRFLKALLPPRNIPLLYFLRKIARPPFLM